MSAARLGRRLAVAARLAVLLGLAQDLGVDELVAGGDEGLGRLALAEAEDHLAVLAQPHRYPREVGIARDDAEAVEVLGVQEVHRVDNHRAVGGVLSGSVRELLDGLYGELEELVLPAAQVSARPIPVDALDARYAIFGDLGKEALQDGGLGVVSVDEHRELELLLVAEAFLLHLILH